MKAIKPSRSWAKNFSGRGTIFGTKGKNWCPNFGQKSKRNDWKLYDGKGKNEKSNRKVKTEKKPYPCQNPFHFLKRHSDLSQNLPTPCPCSNILKKKIEYKFLDIREFINTVPQAPMKYATDPNTERYTTREDLVRGAHDRGKNAKQYFITDLYISNF